MTIIEITKEIIIPLLQVVSVPAVAIISSAKVAEQLKKNNELKEQIRLLTEIPLTYKNGLWYDNGRLPYCPICFSKNRYKIPLDKIASFTYVTGMVMPSRLRCQSCSYEIDDPDFNAS